MGETDGEGLPFGVGDTDGEGEPLGVGETDGDGEPFGLPLGLTEGDGSGVLPKTPFRISVAPLRTSIVEPLLTIGTGWPSCVRRRSRP